MKNIRLTFDIPSEVHVTLTKHIPHGFRKYAYRFIMEGLASELEKDPGPILHAVVEMQLDYVNLIRKGKRDELS
jgi:hypothetical protein